MGGNEKLWELLKDLGIQVPSFLTILGCMIFAVVRWKWHPRVSLVALLGLLLLIIQMFVFAFVYTWVPDWLINAADLANRETTTRNVYLVLGIISNIFLALGFAVLLGAVFMRRDLPQGEMESRPFR